MDCRAFEGDTALFYLSCDFLRFRSFFTIPVRVNELFQKFVCLARLCSILAVDFRLTDANTKALFAKIVQKIFWPIFFAVHCRLFCTTLHYRIALGFSS